MSPREALTVLLGIASLVALGWMAAARMVRTASRWAVQVVAGLTCGAVCAVVAAAPYVDLVPDGVETEAGVAALVLAAAVVAGGARRARGAPPQPASRQRSPGEECAAASSEHSGP